MPFFYGSVMPESAAHDTADSQPIIQHQQVGALAHLDRADLMRQPYLQSRSHGGGVDSVLKGGIGKIAKVMDCLPHRESTTRNGTVVGAGLTVLDGNGVTRDAVFAVGTTRGLHGVGDEDHLLHALDTHDHLDHIRHLGSFCKRLSKPVYTTETIHSALARHTFTAPTIAPCRRILAEGEWNEVAGMKVRYFVVPHDATQTVGYAIEVEDHKFVIMTDIGRMTDEAVEFARQADTVVVESNYDIDMLMRGPYTYELKMRIVQGCGHLSNDECASAIRRFWHPGLRNIFLCHLSENNNTHDLAYRCSADALAGLGVQKGTVALRCLPRQYPSQMYTL